MPAYGEIEYLPDGTWSQTKYNYDQQAAVTLGDGWLLAVVALATPILKDALKKAITSDISRALENLSYLVGALTFSSDDKNITVNYKLPLAEDAIGMCVKAWVLVSLKLT